MIRIEDIRDEPIPVKEWVFSVDEEVDIVRDSLNNGFEMDDSIYKLIPTNFNQDWGLAIFKPIDIPTDLEPICLNCRVTSDTWLRIFGHHRTKVIGMSLDHWLLKKTVDDILNAKIRHYPNMLEGEYLLERFFVMEDSECCRKLLRMGTFLFSSR
jgi:hypothetical protein